MAAEDWIPDFGDLPDQDHVSTCCYCGAPIYWYKAPDGTWVPREDNERSERHRCKPNFESLED